MRRPRWAGPARCGVIVGRLHEDEEGNLADGSHGERGESTHTTGETAALGQRSALEPLTDVEFVRETLGRGAGIRAGHASKLTGDLDGRLRRETVERRLGLRLEGDTASHRGRVCHGVHSGDPDASAVRAKKADYLRDEGRLACAVMAQQPDDLAGTNPEIDLVVGHDIAETPRQAVDL